MKKVGFSVKKLVRVAASDGYFTSGIILFNKKPFIEYMDRGDGGPADLCFVCQSDEGMLSLYELCVAVIKAQCEKYRNGSAEKWQKDALGYIEETLAKTSFDVFKEMIKSSNMSVTGDFFYLAITMEEIIGDAETEKYLRRACKKTTVIRLADADAGSFMEINMPYSEKMDCELTKKYGEDIEIMNKHF